MMMPLSVGYQCLEYISVALVPLIPNQVYIIKCPPHQHIVEQFWSYIQLVTLNPCRKLFQWELSMIFISSSEQSVYIPLHDDFSSIHKIVTRAVPKIFKQYSIQSPISSQANGAHLTKLETRCNCVDFSVTVTNLYLNLKSSS